jgi:hypothetical protein
MLWRKIRKSGVVMARSVTGMRFIENASVWIIMTGAAKAYKDEIKRRISKELQYIRFREFGSSHLMVICEQYTYQHVEGIVDGILADILADT